MALDWEMLHPVVSWLEMHYVLTFQRSALSPSKDCIFNKCTVTVLITVLEKVK